VPETPFLEDEETDVILDGQLLSAIVCNILEVYLEQPGLDSFCDLKVSRRSSKSSVEKKNKRRSVIASKAKKFPHEWHV
jgi:hypothetical protein